MLCGFVAPGNEILHRLLQSKERRNILCKHKWNPFEWLAMQLVGGVAGKMIIYCLSALVLLVSHLVF